MTTEQFMAVVKPEIERLERDHRASIASMQEEINHLRMLAEQRRQTIESLFTALEKAYGLGKTQDAAQ